MSTITRMQSRMTPWDYARWRQRILLKAAVTTLAVLILLVYLLPLGYGIVTSLKTKDQFTDPQAGLLPSVPKTYEYEGQTYEVFVVPTDAGDKEMALVKKGRRSSSFIDPQNPEAGLIEWEGFWNKLKRVDEFAPQWKNYEKAYTMIDFFRLLGNTIMYAFVTMIGAVTSAAVVAYGFARFRFPFKNILFIILMSTIVLPPQVTLIPQYAFFTRALHWSGSWKPLMIPAYFGNAYNIFLLRQYFLTIPRELEEAAKIDGAGPFRTLISVILPQAVPALTAVSLFHFFFAWNDFFQPLLYLSGQRNKVPMAVGLHFFNGIYNREPQLILAASIMTLVLPLIIFFIAQRVFIQGIVITGVEK